MFGDEVEIGNFTLNPTNNYDNFITKLQWSGTTGENKLFDDNNDLLVFPNPATEVISISYSGQEDILFFDMFDRYGRRVSKRSIVNNGQINIDISNLTSGIYIFNFYTKTSKVLSKKIIIK